MPHRKTAVSFEVGSGSLRLDSVYPTTGDQVLSTHLQAFGAGLVVLLGSSIAQAQQQSPQQQNQCSKCAEWNAPQKPFRIYGDTYWVGPHGLGSILIGSGHDFVLVDGALPESAPLIEANIVALGFTMQDVKLILNTHSHFDHAGGLSELQQKSGARVLASPWSAAVLTSGAVPKDDPQFGSINGIKPVAQVGTLSDGQTITEGTVKITAHFTPGHTPGGTSFTWQSCQEKRCLNMVYADSISAVSSDDFLFTAHPQVVASFQQSFNFLDNVPCDILLTPHPESSNFWNRVGGVPTDTLVNTTACRGLAANGRKQLKDRLDRENK